MGRGQPNLYTRKRRVDTDGVTASEPDGDSDPAAGRAVRLMAGDSDVRITSETQAEGEGAQKRCERSHHGRYVRAAARSPLV